MKKYSKRVLALLLSGIFMLLLSMQTFAEENALSVSDNFVSAGDVEEPAVEEADAVGPKAADTVSDNEAEEPEETPKEGMFPGMAGGYQISVYELEQKQSIGKELSDIGKFAEGTDYEANQIIYLAEGEEDAKEKAAAFNAVLDSFDYGIAVAILPQEVSVYDAVAASADVKQLLPPVWPNYIHRALGEVVPEAEESELIENYELAAAYNDPYLNETSGGYQWQHATVGSAYAWNSGYTGSGVKVAVLDTGIAQSHEDVSAVSAKNFVEGESTPYDGNNHGTHVSGIIGARSNNGKGGAGIAPNVSIYSYRVLNAQKEGNEAQTARAIEQAIASKVDIINMSLGARGSSSVLRDAVNKAYEAGIILVAGAGDDGTNGLNYPACLEPVISVAATDIGNGKAPFSNYGSTVDFCAPGVDILSAVSGGYERMSGTSQASAVAAGTAAVLLGANVKGVKDLSGSKRVDAMEKLLKDNTIKASGSQIGTGIVSLPKALKLSTTVTTPNKPVFSLKAGTYMSEQLTPGNGLEVTIQAEPKMVIYYSTDGKTPSYKNGVVKNGILAYSGKKVMLSRGSVTLKAIAVNAVGKSSAVMSAKYTLKGKVRGIQVMGPITEATRTNISPGKTITLKAKVMPDYAKNKEIDWTVDNSPKGITVKNGKVKVAGDAEPGSYTVRATAKDGTGVSGIHNVVVKKASDAKVKKIEFKPTRMTLYRGSTAQTYNAAAVLAVTCQEGASVNEINIIWTTSNSQVAKVSQKGLVTALSSGTAKITATAADGSTKSATQTITVKQYINDLSIYYLDPKEESGTISLGKGKSISLKTTSSTQGITEKKVTWSISPADSGVTISKTGKVTAGKNAAAGIYTVRAAAASSIDAEAPPVATRTIRVQESAIASVSVSKTATIFRVRGNDCLPTSVVLPVTVNGSEGCDRSAWTVSSSSNIVAVKNLGTGKIEVTANSAANPGTATITIKTTDGSNKKATCKVTVLNPASSIAVSWEAGRSRYLSAGKSLKMKASLGTEFGAVSNKKIHWYVSDESQAKVDKNGKVTVKKDAEPGVIWVTAEAADGSGMLRQCHLYVTEPVKKLELSPGPSGDKYEVKINGERLSHYGAIIDKKIGYIICTEFEIKTSNPKSVSGKIQFDNAGNCYLVPFGVEKAGSGSITIKTLDGSGAKDTIKWRYDGKK